MRSWAAYGLLCLGLAGCDILNPVGSARVVLRGPDTAFGRWEENVEMPGFFEELYGERWNSQLPPGYTCSFPIAVEVVGGRRRVSRISWGGAAIRIQDPRTGETTARYTMLASDLNGSRISNLYSGDRILFDLYAYAPYLPYGVELEMAYFDPATGESGTSTLQLNCRES